MTACGFSSAGGVSRLSGVSRIHGRLRGLRNGERKLFRPGDHLEWACRSVGKEDFEGLPGLVAGCMFVLSEFGTVVAGVDEAVTTSFDVRVGSGSEQLVVLAVDG